MYYKFREIKKDCEFFVDILESRRLFLSPWKILNDPYEASFRVENKNLGIVDSVQTNPYLLSKKTAITDYITLKDNAADPRVCAFSTDWKSLLLWAHYADEHKGIAIGFEISSDNDSKIIDVIYDSKIPLVSNPVSQDEMIVALTHKSEEWRYEGEARIVSFDKTPYINIVIREIVFGSEISEEYRNYIIDKLSDLSGVQYYNAIRKPRFYGLVRNSVSL